CGSGEDGARGDNRAAADKYAFVNAGIATDKCLVFHDDGTRADGFQYSANHRSCRKMHVFANLRTATYQSVRIHHAASIHISADIDESGGHYRYSRSDVCTITSGRTAGHEAHLVCQCKLAGGDGMFIKKQLFTIWKSG